jgi:hypothetical protein
MPLKDSAQQGDFEADSAREAAVARGT